MHAPSNDEECPRDDEVIADRVSYANAGLGLVTKSEENRSKLQVMHACGWAAGQAEMRAELATSRKHVRQWKAFALTTAAMVCLVPGLMWMQYRGEAGNSSKQAMADSSRVSNATSHQMVDHSFYPTNLSDDPRMMEEVSVLTPRMLVNLVRNDVWSPLMNERQALTDVGQEPNGVSDSEKLGSGNRSHVLRAGDANWTRFEI